MVAPSCVPEHGGAFVFSKGDARHALWKGKDAAIGNPSNSFGAVFALSLGG